MKFIFKSDFHAFSFGLENGICLGKNMDLKISSRGGLKNNQIIRYLL